MKAQKGFNAEPVEAAVKALTEKEAAATWIRAWWGGESRRDGGSP